MKALVLFVCLFLSACGQEKAYEAHLITFGTLVDITLWGVDEEKAQAVFEGLEKRFDVLNDDWYAWRPGTLSELNAKLASGRPFKADEAIVALVAEAKRLAEKSGYLFDPGIGKLIELWGFQGEPFPDRPPDHQAIADLLAQHPSMADVAIQGDTLACNNPAVKIDLGGFAKGYALDLAIDFLKSQGIRNAIVNMGGDLKAIGRRGDRPWRIGVRHPRKEGVLAVIELEDGESVLTSGDYERYFIYQGRRYHHILDPRTGYPAQGTQSVTVIHPQGGFVDAAATALFVAGPRAWRSLAERMGVRYAMLVDAQGKVHMTPAMEQRVTLVP